MFAGAVEYPQDHHDGHDPDEYAVWASWRGAERWDLRPRPMTFRAKRREQHVLAQMSDWSHGLRRLGVARCVPRRGNPGLILLKT